MATEHLKKQLQIDEISQDDVDFIVTHAAQKAQEIVNKYSYQQIIKDLDALNNAKQMAIETGVSVFVALQLQ